MKRALYPGTFDPITKGHLDVLDRSLALFDEVVIGVAENPNKDTLFSIEERLDFIKCLLKDTPKASVVSFKGLTVDFAKKHAISVLIRGLRAVSDFEYEFQMAQMQRHLDATIETIFLMPSHQYFYTSSQLIKEIARFAPERIAKFIPEMIIPLLKKKLN